MIYCECEVAVYSAPSKMGMDVTAFGLPILLTLGNTLYPISFLGFFYPLPFHIPTTMTSIEGRPKAVTSILIFLGHKTQLNGCAKCYVTVPGYL